MREIGNYLRYCAHRLSFAWKSEYNSCNRIDDGWTHAGQILVGPEFLTPATPGALTPIAASVFSDDSTIYVSAVRYRLSAGIPGRRHSHL